jgi:membrane protein
MSRAGGAGGLLIARATSNPLLGAVAVGVGLLFWLNLMSRVTLLSAAWAANDADVATVGVTAEPQPMGPTGAAPYAVGLPPRAMRSRAVDRVSLAAGAVLGAVGAALALTARRLRGRR